MPPSKLPADAAAVLFDTLVAFIKEGLRTVLVAGLIVAAGGFLAGPSATAVWIRGAFARGLGWIRHGGQRRRVHRPGGQVDLHAPEGASHLRRALAALVFVFWGQPTAVIAIVIAVVLLVVLALIELIGSRPPAQPETAGHTSECSWSIVA